MFRTALLRSLLIHGFLLFALAQYSIAQKIGYVNYDEVLVNAPGIKAVDKKLASFQDSLSAIFREKEGELYAKYQPVQQKIQEGLLAPKDVAQIQREYNLEEQKLNDFGKSMQEAIMSRRQQLILPMIQRVNTAIETIGREGSYDYIFDSGMGRKTFFNPADDLTPTVLDWLANN